MASILSSMSSAYPPKLSPAQADYLLSNVKDWSILNGLAVRPSRTFIPENINLSGSLAVTAPVTLFPSLFPKGCFEEAKDIQLAYNELYVRIASDEKWLRGVVEGLVDVDDFIANLWNVHLAVKKEGYVQSLSLGIFRSDYMVQTDPAWPQTSPKLKQVEFNTIASSFGGLAAKVSRLHKHLLQICAYPADCSSILKNESLPPNHSESSIASGLAAAHTAYGPSKHQSKLPLCVIFVVQNPENNAFDQHAVATILLDRDGILPFRLPFANTLTHTRIPQDCPSRPLIYIPPHSPSTLYEVTTVYFRAGYSPDEYLSSNAWDARLHFERSAAIKCPSILTHLAGSKKVQQILATPSSPHLDRFISQNSSTAEYINRIKGTFAAMYPLDDTPAGQHALRIASDAKESTNYVLKPQREGGGNNIYGAKIPLFLKALGNDSKKYRGHILMELIQPPSLRNSVFRNGQVTSGEMVGELGVYGVALWHHEEDSARPSILKNSEAGYLLRTKGKGSEEGGVAAGFGAVDSICLFDDTLADQK